MQNSLRCKLRSDTLLFFFITQNFPTLELLNSLQNHLAREYASRWELDVEVIKWLGCCYAGNINLLVHSPWSIT